MARSTLTRRIFIQNLRALGIAATAILPAQSIAADDLDRFRGLESVQFKPSGYFRVEKADRWWFVTPDGSAFLLVFRRID